VIRVEKLDRSYRARFAFEQDALARMDHPGIARLYDAGETGGRAWFAMEYVPGRPITAFCDEHQLDVAARLRLFLAVCDAVDHAHMRGILHRDLTPGNVLVREVDGRVAAKVIDFGLAQPSDPSRIRATLHEPVGLLVGTLQYMSPEQALRGGKDLDVRTDVYALGVLLHELMTGLLPVDVRAVAAAGFAALPTLWQGPPPRPMSTVVAAAADAAALATARATSPRRLAAALRGDLDVVVGAAIERDRLRRYASVRDFARDVARVLAREPIEARPPSPLRRARLFVQRHATAAAVVATALAAGVLLLAQTVELARERARLAEAELLANDPLTVVGLLESRRVLRGDRGGAAAIAAWLAQARPILDRAALHRARAAAGATQAAAFADKTLPELAAAVASAVEWRADLEWLEAFEVEHEARWAEVRAAVKADPRYDGLDLRPQFGLHPLLCDPVTNLHEFLLVDARRRRGLGAALPAPTRGASGELVLPLDHEPVLVLLPGGEFEMGTPEAQVPGVDGEEAGIERPAHRVRVPAFFIGKHEVTIPQHGEPADALGRWDADLFAAEQRRLRAANVKVDDAVTRRVELAPLPIGNVNWHDAARVAARLGARLPTESEWEYAARGGTKGAWSCAADEATVRTAANLIDCLGADDRVPVTTTPRLDFFGSDGVGPPAPIGSFAANPFGLHDVHGNLSEWCAGPPYDYATGAIEAPAARTLRGGSHAAPIQRSRSAARAHANAAYAANDVGYRLARDVESSVPAPR
jgi:formylglycine-generating enzyme required for sulfatase activity